MPKPGLSRIAVSLLTLALILVSLSACASPAAGQIVPTETPVAQAPRSAQPTLTPSTSPTRISASSALSLSISPDLPNGLREQLKLPASIKLVEDSSSASLTLSIAVEEPSSRALKSANWIYAVVVPFPTVQDSVSLGDLQKIWSGKSTSGQPQSLLMTANTRAVLAQLWGQPDPRGVKVVDKNALLDTAWKDIPLSPKPAATSPAATPTASAPSPLTLAIIPFEEIEPRWKVLSVDGQSPMERSFDPSKYPLAVRIAITAGQETDQNSQALSMLALPTNYDPSKLTVLVMTGTTAISRHIGERMEEHGMTYPAQDIRDWLASADLTHISNEVSFYKDCPKPGPNRADMRFCSSPKYIQLLEDVGTDIVELTGNHNLDWGYQPFLDSLEMYRQRGWKIYGGGASLEDAKKPLLITDHGNRLAFIGCSPSGPAPVWATQYTPGSLPCSMDKLEQQVRQLRASGYLPIVTFQAVETDTYLPAPAQATPNFRRMASAGAVIVSGSQSHVPQTMTLMGGSFVHYGLGNLFFDQMTPPESRQEFIDQHVFYDGKYLGVHLYTALLEDYARPRPMTASERSDFLRKIFALCSWNEN